MKTSVLVPVYLRHTKNSGKVKNDTWWNDWWLKLHSYGNPIRWFPKVQWFPQERDHSNLKRATEELQQTLNTVAVHGKFPDGTYGHRFLDGNVEIIGNEVYTTIDGVKVRVDIERLFK